MKRVKLMLTAIIVLAAVGGALAFKAKTFAAVIFCDIPGSTFCNHSVINWTIEGTANAAHCTFFSQESDCPAVFTRGKV